MIKVKQVTYLSTKKTIREPVPFRRIESLYQNISFLPCSPVGPLVVVGHCEDLRVVVFEVPEGVLSMLGF
jgi:hypothetical protein